MDWSKFSRDRRIALYQCRQLARGFRGKVIREEKEPVLLVLSYHTPLEYNLPVRLEYV